MSRLSVKICAFLLSIAVFFTSTVSAQEYAFLRSSTEITVKKVQHDHSFLNLILEKSKGSKGAAINLDEFWGRFMAVVKDNTGLSILFALLADSGDLSPQLRQEARNLKNKLLEKPLQRNLDLVIAKSAFWKVLNEEYNRGVKAKGTGYISSGYKVGDVFRGRGKSVSSGIDSFSLYDSSDVFIEDVAVRKINLAAKSLTKGLLTSLEKKGNDENNLISILVAFLFTDTFKPFFCKFETDKGLNGFALPVERVIGWNASVSNNPIARFHEIMHYLLGISFPETGYAPLKLSVSDNVFSVDFKYNSTAQYSTLYSFQLSINHNDFLYSEGWDSDWSTDPHYLIRLLQFHLFGKKDAALSRNISQEEAEVNESKEMSPVFIPTQSDLDSNLRSKNEVLNELKGQLRLLKEIVRQKSYEERIDIFAEADLVSMYRKGKNHNYLQIDIDDFDFKALVEKGRSFHISINGFTHELKGLEWLGGTLWRVSDENNPWLSRGVSLDELSRAVYWVQKDKYVDIQTEVLASEISAMISHLEHFNTTGSDAVDYLLRLKSPPVLNFEDGDVTFDAKLNLFQNLYKNIAKKSALSLLLGPFGTGKTTTAVSIIQDLVAANNNGSKCTVISVASQHKILDDVLTRCKSKGIDILRIGRVSEKMDLGVVDDALNAFSKQDKFNALHDIREKGGVIGGTAMGLILDSFLGDLFSNDYQRKSNFGDNIVMIVEEAALLERPLLLALVRKYRPTKLILMGDHYQFDVFPVKASHTEYFDRLKKNISKKTIEDYERSLFKELQQHLFPGVYLPINMRNKRSVVYMAKYGYPGISLRCLPYNGKQSNGIFKRIDTSHSDKRESVRYVEPEEEGEDDELEYHIYNKGEANIALCEVKALLSGEYGSKYKVEDIFVITPYKGQVAYIREMIEEDDFFEEDVKKVLQGNINTTRTVQGLENKVVILSMVRSRPKNKKYSYNKEDPPIIADLGLFTVGITRSSEIQIVIGDKSTLVRMTAGSPDPKVRGLYKHLFETEILAEEGPEPQVSAESVLTLISDDGIRYMSKEDLEKEKEDAIDLLSDFSDNDINADDYQVHTSVYKKTDEFVSSVSPEAKKEIAKNADLVVSVSSEELDVTALTEILNAEDGLVSIGSSTLYKVMETSTNKIQLRFKELFDLPNLKSFQGRKFELNVNGHVYVFYKTDNRSWKLSLNDVLFLIKEMDLPVRDFSGGVKEKVSVIADASEKKESFSSTAGSMKFQVNNACFSVGSSNLQKIIKKSPNVIAARVKSIFSLPNAKDYDGESYMCEVNDMSFEFIKLSNRSWGLHIDKLEDFLGVLDLPLKDNKLIMRQRSELKAPSEDEVLFSPGSLYKRNEIKAARQTVSDIINKSVSLPDVLEYTEESYSFELNEEMFSVYKRVNVKQGSPRWYMREGDIIRFARSAGIESPLRNVPVLGERYICMSSTNLAKIARTSTEKIKSYFNDFKIPQAVGSTLEEFEISNGEKTAKLKKGRNRANGHIDWYIHEDSLSALRSILLLDVVPFVLDDEFTITVNAKNPLCNFFMKSVTIISRRMKEKINLPSSYAENAPDIELANGIKLYRRRNGTQVVWAIKKKDVPKFADMLRLNLYGDYYLSIGEDEGVLDDLLLEKAGFSKEEINGIQKSFDQAVREGAKEIEFRVNNKKYTIGFRKSKGVVVPVLVNSQIRGFTSSMKLFFKTNELADFPKMRYLEKEDRIINGVELTVDTLSQSLPDLSKKDIKKILKKEINLNNIIFKNKGMFVQINESEFQIYPSGINQFKKVFCVSPADYELLCSTIEAQILKSAALNIGKETIVYEVNKKYKEIIYKTKDADMGYVKYRDFELDYNGLKKRLINKIQDEDALDLINDLFEVIKRDDADPDVVVFNELFKGSFAFARPRQRIIGLHASIIDNDAALLHELLEYACVKNESFCQKIISAVIDSDDWIERKVKKNRGTFTTRSHYYIRSFTYKYLSADDEALGEVIKNPQEVVRTNFGLYSQLDNIAQKKNQAAGDPMLAYRVNGKTFVVRGKRTRIFDGRVTVKLSAYLIDDVSFESRLVGGLEYFVFDNLPGYAFTDSALSDNCFGNKDVLDYPFYVKDEYRKGNVIGKALLSCASQMMSDDQIKAYGYIAPLGVVGKRIDSIFMSYDEPSYTAFVDKDALRRFNSFLKDLNGASYFFGDEKRIGSKEELAVNSAYQKYATGIASFIKAERKTELLHVRKKLNLSEILNSFIEYSIHPDKWGDEFSGIADFNELAYIEKLSFMKEIELDYEFESVFGLKLNSLTANHIEAFFESVCEPFIYSCLSKDSVPVSDLDVKRFMILREVVYRRFYGGSVLLRSFLLINKKKYSNGRGFILENRTEFKEESVEELIPVSLPEEDDNVLVSFEQNGFEFKVIMEEPFRDSRYPKREIRGAKIYDVTNDNKKVIGGFRVPVFESQQKIAAGHMSLVPTDFDGINHTFPFFIDEDYTKRGLGVILIHALANSLRQSGCEYFIYYNPTDAAKKMMTDDLRPLVTEGYMALSEWPAKLPEWIFTEKKVKINVDNLKQFEISKDSVKVPDVFLKASEKDFIFAERAPFEGYRSYDFEGDLLTSFYAEASGADQWREFEEFDLKTYITELSLASIQKLNDVGLDFFQEKWNLYRDVDYFVQEVVLPVLESLHSKADEQTVRKFVFLREWVFRHSSYSLMEKSIYLFDVFKESAFEDNREVSQVNGLKIEAADCKYADTLKLVELFCKDFFEMHYKIGQMVQGQSIKIFVTGESVKAEDRQPETIYISEDSIQEVFDPLRFFSAQGKKKSMYDSFKMSLVLLMPSLVSDMERAAAKELRESLFRMDDRQKRRRMEVRALFEALFSEMSEYDFDSGAALFLESVFQEWSLLLSTGDKREGALQGIDDSVALLRKAIDNVSLDCESLEINDDLFAYYLRIGEAFSSLCELDAELVWDVFALPLLKMKDAAENSKTESIATKAFVNALERVTGDESVVSELTRISNAVDVYLNETVPMSFLDVYVDPNLKKRKGYVYIENMLNGKYPKAKLHIRYVDNPFEADLMLLNEDSQIRSDKAYYFSYRLKDFACDLYFFDMFLDALLVRSFTIITGVSSLPSWFSKIGKRSFSSDIGKFFNDSLKSVIAAKCFKTAA